MEFDWLFDEEKEELIWQTRDKEQIPISKLSTSHIKNIIRVLKVKKYKLDLIPILESELIRRTEEFKYTRLDFTI